MHTCGQRGQEEFPLQLNFCSLCACQVGKNPSVSDAWFVKWFCFCIAGRINGAGERDGKEAGCISSVPFASGG